MNLLDHLKARAILGNQGLPGVHPYYFFHGYAGNQVSGDSAFYDLAAGNHGVRGANLSAIEMGANAGFITTKAPSNPYDTCIRIPNLNYDWVGQEKLFLFWRGIAATPAAESAVMGDGTATTSGNYGIQIRNTTAGKVYMSLFGADGGKIGAISSSTVFDGTIHDFAFLMDGKNKNYAMWIDGTLDPSFAGSYAPFNQAYILDTKNSNTFNIGAAAKAPGVATLPQGGMVTQTRCFVIVRMPASYAVPSIATVTAAIAALRVNPGKLLLAGAL